MKWNHYATEADRTRRLGIEVTGQVWSAADRGRWAWPDGAEHNSASLVVVFTHGGESWSVGQLPAGSHALNQLCSICGHTGPGMKISATPGQASNGQPICADRTSCQRRAADRLAGTQ